MTKTIFKYTVRRAHNSVHDNGSWNDYYLDMYYAPQEIFGSTFNEAKSLAGLHGEWDILEMRTHEIIFVEEPKTSPEIEALEKEIAYIEMADFIIGSEREKYEALKAEVKRLREAL